MEFANLGPTALSRVGEPSVSGRDELLAGVAEALAVSRLVTLVGPGGSGKTALAKAVAASFEGEVRIVELGSMAPEVELPTAVIDALGVRNESLGQALAGRELLLVLDNCEHLVDAVARLADELLDGCPRLRILATSTKALWIRDETRFAVPGLAPDAAVSMFAGLLPVERVVAVRLAIFSGGATPESVAAVLDLPQPVTARLLTTLTERSLLTLTDGRYRMPGTIRAYAGEQLTSAETDDLRARQAAYLLQLVRRADQRLRGPEQLQWATLLDQERDNLRTAIGWAVEHDQRLALELVAGLSTYWWMRGRQREAARAAEALLAVLGDVVPDGLAEEYLLAVLHAAGSGRVDGVERANAVVEELGGPFRHPVAVLLWWMVLGPFAPPEFVTEVLDRNELSNNPWTLAVLQYCAGQPDLGGAGTAASEENLRAALTGFRRVGDRWGVSLALHALADLAASARLFDRYGELISQALSIADELGSDEEAALLLCRRGDLRLRLGQPRAAGEDYGRALVRARRIGLPDSVAAAQIGLARSARYDGDLAKAENLALQAMDECPTGWADADLATTEILSELAAIADAAGRPDEANAWRHKAGLPTGQNSL